MEKDLPSHGGSAQAWMLAIEVTNRGLPSLNALIQIKLKSWDQHQAVFSIRKDLRYDLCSVHAAGGIKKSVLVGRLDQCLLESHYDSPNLVESDKIQT